MSIQEGTAHKIQIVNSIEFFYSIYRVLPRQAQNLSASVLARMLRPKLQQHFSALISPGDLVFDIGAHEGFFTSIFVDLGAEVVAVEPQPYCVQELHEKFSSEPNVVVVDKGVSNSPGTLPLAVATDSRVNSTFSPGWRQHPRLEDCVWEKKVHVPVTTLEDLTATYGEPGFCKIDVEGHEARVLQGLQHSIPLLSFEFDQFYFENFLGCVDHLESLGDVRYNYALYNGSSFDVDQWMPADQLVARLQSQLNGYLRGDIYAQVA